MRASSKVVVRFSGLLHEVGGDRLVCDAFHGDTSNVAAVVAAALWWRGFPAHEGSLTAFSGGLHERRRRLPPVWRDRLRQGVIESSDGPSGRYEPLITIDPTLRRWRS